MTFWDLIDGSAEKRYKQLIVGGVDGQKLTIQYKSCIWQQILMWNKITSFFSSSSSKEQKNLNSNNNADDMNQQQEAYQQQQNYIPQQQNSIPLHQEQGAGVKLLKAVDSNKKVVAVIVTFVSGSSYDHLFTSVEQKVEEGTQVLVYACQSHSVKDINDGFQKQSKNETMKQMIKYIKQVDPDCVVFNWQCSSGYSAQSFNEGGKQVISFARKMIDRGHMTMFSDFSLKALISQWDQKILGPNPFVKVSQYGGNFTLQFEPGTLKQCPSAQLQIIGDMASEGHCNVQAMGGTIVYGLNKKKADNPEYKLQVLTVVTSIKNNQASYCKIKDKQGQAGHVLLTYKSGGHLLTSMGHWIQLMKIDTSEKVLFEVAERQFGGQRAAQMKQQYMNLSNQVQRKQYISRNAVEFVQSQAPCANMAKKARSKY